MSQSKSSKTDPEQELMWQKLSTLPVSQGEKDRAFFQQRIGRSFRSGFNKGEVVTIAAKSGVGKSFFDIKDKA